MNNLKTYIALFWLFVSSNSFLVWGNYKSLIILFANILVIFISFKSVNTEKSSFQERISIPIILMALFVLWSRLVSGANFIGFLAGLITILSFSSLLRWPFKDIEQTYNYFVKIIVFFCIGSSVVSLLTLTGFIGHVPHFTLPPQSYLHQSRGYLYYVYGCFVTVFDGTAVLPRACGFLQEPGHFAVIVGLVYLIETTLGRKRNIGIIIGGLFTFSMNFIIMALLSELFRITSYRQALKATKCLLISMIGGFVLFNFLPKDIKEQLLFFFWERNLMEVVDTVQETSSLTEGMNDRANDISEWKYNHLSGTDKLVGTGGLDEDDMLSDYRGMITSKGYIGLFISVSLILSIVFLSHNWRQRIPLLGAIGLVYMHRAWMMNSMYIYYIAFMAVVMYRLQHENRMIIEKPIEVES